jgi:hypothetical protein
LKSVSGATRPSLKLKYFRGRHDFAGCVSGLAFEMFHDGLD